MMKKTYFLLCLYSPCMLYAADMLSMPKAKAPQNNKEVIAQISSINAELTFVPNPSINSTRHYNLDLIQSEKSKGVIGGEHFEYSYEPLVNTTNLTKTISDSITYYPLIEPNKIWYISESKTIVDQNGNFVKGLSHVISEKVEKDTIINNKTYQKFIKEPVSYYQNSNVLNFLREDTIERKVYFLIYNDSGIDSGKFTEHLYYNFDWKNNQELSAISEIGRNDPFITCEKTKIKFPQYYSYKVNNTDSFSYYTHPLINDDNVENSDSANTKNYCNMNNPFNIKFINRVGNNVGLFNSMFNYSEFDFVNLSCVTVDGNVVYRRSENSTCEIVRNINNQNSFQLSIYPNPSSLSTLITLPQPTGTLTVVDALGRIVHTAINLSTSTYELNTSIFAAGLYQVRYSYVGGTAVGKVMVQR